MDVHTYIYVCSVQYTTDILMYSIRCIITHQRLVHASTVVKNTASSSITNINNKTLNNKQYVTLLL